MVDKFAGIRLGRRAIEHSRDSRPRVGLSAVIVRGESLLDHVDEPDFLLLDGVTAQLLKKGVQAGAVYLAVRGPSFEWCVPLDADSLAKARAFADKVNAATPLE